MIEDPARPVLISGASTGIGRTTCEFLASNGHYVFAGARKATDLEQLGRIPRVTAVQLDVTDPKGVELAVKKVREAGHGLYGLVNNAGISGEGPLIETPVAELERILAVNLVGTHRVVHAFAPMIVKARGRIVNISSLAGLVTMTWFGPYGTSKHAIEGYSEILREELSLLGVHVSTIEPGNFRTRIASHRVDREGRKLDDTVAEPAFREPMKGVAAYIARLNGNVYPEPTPVAEAVSHALFSETPKKRYGVFARDWLGRAVDKIFDDVRQVNEGSLDPLSSAELLDRLRSRLAADSEKQS